MGKAKKQNIYKYKGKRTGEYRYRIVFWYLDSFGLMRQTTKRGFTSADEAEKALIDIKSAINNDEYKKQKMIKLEMFLNDWIENIKKPNIRQNTYEGYKVNIDKHIIPYLGKLYVHELNKGKIKRLYSELKKLGGLNDTSIKYVHSVFRQALDYAVSEEIIKENFATNITIKKSDFSYEIYSIAELNKLIEIARDTDMLIPILLACFYGLRRAEILGLKWNNVDFENKTIKIDEQLLDNDEGLYFDDTKSKHSVRTLPLTDSLVIILKRHKEIQKIMALSCKYNNEHNLVCCNNNGSIISTSAFSHRFKKFLEGNGLKHIRFHDLRHSFATAMADNGNNIASIASMLGDTKDATLIYLHAQKTIDVKPFEAHESAIKVIKEIAVANDKEKVLDDTIQQ